MSNEWAFAVDPDHWLPIPPVDRLDNERRAVWVERATALAARANLAELEEIDALRTLCTEIIATADHREACAFFPVMEGGPVRAEMTTLPKSEWRAQLSTWERHDDRTRNCDSTAYTHNAFDDAQRIMRVDESPTGEVLFSVAFLGHDEARLLCLSMTTTNPLVAGQFGAFGERFFMSFRALDAAAHG